MRIASRIVLALVLMMSAGCIFFKKNNKDNQTSVANQGDQKSFGIWGGIRDYADDAVGELIVPGSSCSGTLLCPNVFITAGHCVAGRVPTDIYFTNANDARRDFVPPQSSPQGYYTTFQDPNNKIYWAQGESQIIIQVEQNVGIPDGIALVKLKPETAVMFAGVGFPGISSQHPTLAQPDDVFGYGLSHVPFGQSDYIDVKRYTTLIFSEKSGDIYTYHDLAQLSQICAGDSGGPLFDGGKVLGVAYAGNSQCTMQGYADSLFMSTVQAKTIIEQKLAEWCAPYVYLQAVDRYAVENPFKIALFEVVRTVVSPAALRVNLTWNPNMAAFPQAAKPVQDFTAQPSLDFVDIPANQASAQVTVVPVTDQLDEGKEPAEIALANGPDYFKSSTKNLEKFWVYDGPPFYVKAQIINGLINNNELNIPAEYEVSTADNQPATVDLPVNFEYKPAKVCGANDGQQPGGGTVDFNFSTDPNFNSALVNYNVVIPQGQSFVKLYAFPLAADKFWTNCKEKRGKVTFLSTSTAVGGNVIEVAVKDPATFDLIVQQAPLNTVSLQYFDGNRVATETQTTVKFIVERGTELNKAIDIAVYLNIPIVAQNGAIPPPITNFDYSITEVAGGAVMPQLLSQNDAYSYFIFTIEKNKASKTFEITPVADGVPENRETVNITLASADHYKIGNKQLTFHIDSFDPPPPTNTNTDPNPPPP